MKHIALLSFLLALPLSTLACDRPSPPKPLSEIPSTDEILDSINEMQAYIKAGMSYVDCTEKAGKSSPLINEMNSTIEQHNQFIRAYQERLRIGQQQEIDKNQ